MHEVRAGECTEYPSRMMKRAPAHPLLAFQNTLPLLPPVVHCPPARVSAKPAQGSAAGEQVSKEAGEGSSPPVVKPACSDVCNNEL